MDVSHFRYEFEALIKSRNRYDNHLAALKQKMPLVGWLVGRKPISNRMNMNEVKVRRGEASVSLSAFCFLIAPD